VPHVEDWQFVSGQKKHTQDGSQLVSLMKGIGMGRRPSAAVDIGCGDGIIAFDMLTRKRATRVVAIDVLPEAVRAASHNLRQFIEADSAQVKRVSAAHFFRLKSNWDRFDLFAINPPFFASGSGRPNKFQTDQWARHDEKLGLKLWARGARRLLRTGGHLYCVFPTERLSETLKELSVNGVEPKEIWWFKDDLRKRRFFLRAVRGAKPGLVVHFDYIQKL
jgi:tRNA1(Val) A37 N6-methylase TrmN6